MTNGKLLVEPILRTSYQPRTCGCNAKTKVTMQSQGEMEEGTLFIDDMPTAVHGGGKRRADEDEPGDKET